MSSPQRFSASMTISLVAILALSLTLLISIRSAVHASSAVPASTPHIIVFPKSGPPNVSTQVSGKHFGPTETVALTIDTSIPLGTATTDSTGAFSTSVKVPKTELPGSHTITATGQTSKITAQGTYLVDTTW